VPFVQASGAFVRSFGLEEDALHVARAAIALEHLEQPAPGSMTADSHVELVEHDVEPADLERPAPRHHRIPLRPCAVVREPDHAAPVVGQQWFEARGGRTRIEPVVVGGAVLRDEFEHDGKIVGCRSPDAARHAPDDTGSGSIPRSACAVIEPRNVVSMTAHGHPLAAVLVAAAHGSFPPADGRVEVVPPDDRGTEAVVEFTGHAFVLTHRDPGDESFHGVDAFGGVGHPRFVFALAGDATIGSHDVVLVRHGGSPAEPLVETDRYDDHPRVMRARHHRHSVNVLGDERGLVTIGAGLVGRIELSVELAGEAGGRGAGRALILGGLATVPTTELVFAQVAPGNSASLRAFLACGFRPIGSEILIEPHTSRERSSVAIP
jgi:hypothetical protein